MIINVTEENFEKEVLQSDVPVLVDFGRHGVACIIQGEILDAFANDIGTKKAKICKVDIDVERNLAYEYQIMSIPTLITFNNGKIDQKSVGISNEGKLKNMLGLSG